MKKKLGFIGLGVMGFPMATNLLNDKYELTAYDINLDKVKELSKKGTVQRATSPREVALKTETIILMLPNTPHVEEVIFGEDGLIHSLRPDSLIIDMSSISPIATKEIAKKLDQEKIRFLDAPVSGGEVKAISGELTVMVGGNKEDFEQSKPVFSSLGKNIIYCGEHGSGQTVKVVNQLMSAVNLISMSEGFILGVNGGVDPEIMHTVIKNGSGNCWAVEDRMPVILENNFKPGFTIDLHSKDLSLALEMARELNVPLYATSLVHEIFKTLQIKGKGSEDNSAVIKYYEELTGMKVRKRERLKKIGN